MYTRLDGIPIEYDIIVSEKYENSSNTSNCIVPSCYYIMISLTFAIAVAIVVSLSCPTKKVFFSVVGFVLSLCILGLVWCVSSKQLT